MIRCRIPPENSCGYCLKRVGGMPIPASASSERRRISSLSRSGSCAFSVSRKWSSIVSSGSRRVIGSWKISPSSGPRMLAHLLRRRSRRRFAAAIANLAGDRGALGQQPEHAAAERRLAAAGLADEPECLARARARSETPSTARTGSPSVPYQTRRSLTERIGSLTADLRSTRHRRCSGSGAGPARLPLRDLGRSMRRVRISGLRTSLRPSPTSVKPVTSSTIAMPGKRPVHQMPAPASSIARCRS